MPLHLVASAAVASLGVTVGSLRGGAPRAGPLVAVAGISVATVGGIISVATVAVVVIIVGIKCKAMAPVTKSVTP